MTERRDLVQRVLEERLTLDALDDRFDVLGTRYSGKVRENFTRGRERIIVVTDRISAFDVVLGTIPLKGQVLSGVAQFWFDLSRRVIDHHLLEVLDPQAVRVVECEPIPVEMIVRGYLTGSTSTSIYRAYERGDRVFCGHRLPDGLRKHEKLPQNIVTPSTKAPKGHHDESVSKDELFARGLVTPEVFDTLEQACLRLFSLGQETARERGLILADTKYELGRTPDGRIVLIDEIHTPDSSRYWYQQGYDQAMSRGDEPVSFDKEYVRRWLVERGFSGDGPAPVLTDEVRTEAALRYFEIFEAITGRAFEPDLTPPVPRLLRNLGLAG